MKPASAETCIGKGSRISLTFRTFVLGRAIPKNNINNTFALILGIQNVQYLWRLDKSVFFVHVLIILWWKNLITRVISLRSVEENWIYGLDSHVEKYGFLCKSITPLDASLLVFRCYKTFSYYFELWIKNSCVSYLLCITRSLMLFTVNAVEGTWCPHWEYIKYINSLLSKVDKPRKQK